MRKNKMVTYAEKYYGRLITEVELEEEKLNIIFDGGERIYIIDAAQDCREHRYMTTDDDIQSLVGHTLIGIRCKDGPRIKDSGHSFGEDGYYEHDTMFLEIQTSGGFITIVNHNEYNGFYDGFRLFIRELEPCPS
jgi:hypothetical protein